MTICPTGAIVEPYTVDARRCISYLTIELEGAIPEELRPLIGNRIYGCDDCQLICPWNRFSQLTDEADFSPRQALHAPPLIELFAWSEAHFLKVTEGLPSAGLAICAGYAILPSHWAMRPGMRRILPRWKVAEVSTHYSMNTLSGRWRNKLTNAMPTSSKCNCRRNSVWSG
jgi:hypothetical protein